MNFVLISTPALSYSSEVFDLELVEVLSRIARQTDIPMLFEEGSLGRWYRHYDRMRDGVLVECSHPLLAGLIALAAEKGMIIWTKQNSPAVNYVVTAQTLSHNQAMALFEGD